MDAETYQITMSGNNLVERSLQLCWKLILWLDVMKQETKASLFASEPESYLEDFGIESLKDSSFVCAKKYIMRVISSKSNCKTFDTLKVWNVQGKRENSECTFTNIKHHSWTFIVEPLQYLSLQNVNGSLKMDC